MLGCWRARNDVAVVSNCSLFTLAFVQTAYYSTDQAPPCAKYGTWNAGLCCGISKQKNLDDVEFISKLIAKLKGDFNIDGNRVYVAGVSNGGMMAYRLGHELSDQIAAIAPIEGCMYQRNETAGEAVSVIAIHGTRDPVIPYDGGTGKWLGIKLKVPSVSDAINFWVGHSSGSEHCRTAIASLQFQQSDIQW